MTQIRNVLRASTWMSLSLTALVLTSSGTPEAKSRTTRGKPEVIAITSPAAGSAHAYSPVTVTAELGTSGVAGKPVAGVQFKLDGVNLGNEDTTPPYSVSWDTIATTVGAHVLTAVVRFEAPSANAPASSFTSDPVAVSVVPCATPLAPFPGSTAFNNTVRGQMWITNDNWWGAFSDNATGIYFYSRQGSEFVKGALIDTTFSAGRNDTLWNGSELFVAVFKSGALATLYKYSFSPISGDFVLFPGFPVDLPLAGLANAISIAQDSTGKLWATYTSGNSVNVIWSTSPDHLIWNTTGVTLEDTISTRTTEAATITHFGGDKIGVAWGNQAIDEYAFKFRLDSDLETNWSAKEVVTCGTGSLLGTCLTDGPAADDHLSVRAAPDGRLFLVSKDNVPAQLGPGRLNLFVRSASGVWGPRLSVDTEPLSQPTRPNLALDVQNNHAYVFYHNSTDGRVYVARTAMDNPSFGRCVFLSNANSVTTTKQSVNATTGLIAAGSANGQIFSALIPLGSAASPQSSPPTVASTSGAMSAVSASAALSAPLDEPSAVDFAAIREGLSSSLSPASPGQWRWLRGKGINTIILLDGDMVDLAQFGFESFLWVPLRAGEPPTREDAERFLTFIQMPENRPAHLSGASADGRALMLALARYAIDGWSLDAALSEGLSLNGVGLSLSTTQVGWLMDWAAKHAPGSHRHGRGAAAQ